MTGKTLVWAWLVLIALAMVWGSSFILIKKALLAFSPFQIGAIRVSLAFLFLFAIAIFHINKVPRKKYIYLFVSGMLGVFFPAFFFPIAQTHLSSSITGALNTTVPLFTLLFGLLFFKQTTNLAQVVGLLVGFLGTLMLLFAESVENLNFNSYALFAIAASMCYAINLNIVKTFLSDIKPLQVSTLTLFFIGPIMMIYLTSLDIPQTYQNNLPESYWALLSLAALAFFATSLASIFFNKLIQISSPIFASSVTYLIPIVALFWGILDNEKLLLGHYLGMGAIILGVYLVNRKKKNKVVTRPLKVQS